MKICAVQCPAVVQKWWHSLHLCSSMHAHCCHLGNHALTSATDTAIDGHACTHLQGMKTTQHRGPSFYLSWLVICIAANDEQAGHVMILDYLARAHLMNAAAQRMNAL